MCVCVCGRAFSMISPRKSPQSPCFFLSVVSLGGWLSFKPNFEAQLALEVPRRAFQPSFPVSHLHRLTIGECASPLSTSVDCRPQIDSLLSPVFGECLSKHAFNEASKESTVRRPNGQVRVFVDPPLSLSLSTGPWPSCRFTVWTRPTHVQHHADLHGHSHFTTFCLVSFFLFPKSFQKKISGTWATCLKECDQNFVSADFNPPPFKNNKLSNFCPWTET